MVLVGLRKFHIAKLLTDTQAGTTYEVPKQITGAIRAGITPKVSSDKLYADDVLSEQSNNFDSVDVEIETKYLSLTQIKELTGGTIENGMFVSNKDDSAPDIALGFMSKKNNGKFRYVWLTKGKFEPASEEYGTAEDKTKFNTPKIKGTFVAREFDGNWRYMTDEDEEGFTAQIGADWFKKVPGSSTGGA